jgi:2-keto-3-deoxy-L-rhamnonate aldolase RhmA
MTENIKKRINSGETTIGSWLQIGHPAVMEYMSSYNFDWLTVDLEHTDITLETFSNLLRSAHGKNVFARVRENNTIAIRQVLDAGANGVIVPLVNNAEGAKRAVMAAKFPPIGIRGFAFFRANNYGLEFDAYAKNANDRIVVIVMVETKEAIQNIDEILDVEGIDGVLIGPYDLSGSYGIPGDTQSPVIQKAMKRVVSACKAHGKSAGMHQVGLDAQQIKNVFADGFSFVAVGMDNVFLGKGLDETMDVLKNISEGR